MLDTFRHMVNDCIRIGLENNVVSMKKLCMLSYKHLDKYNIYANYKLCAIARAAGIIVTRSKSIKRGHKTKDPYMVKLMLTGYLGFKILDNKIIRIPLGDKKYFDITLNKYVQNTLSNQDLRIRSFTLTANTISITYSKEIREIETTSTSGIDRNLRNLTYGNCNRIIQYDLSQAIEIAETTKDIIKSFKRNDKRIQRKLYAKYGKRRKYRITQMLHRISKHIVQQARESKEAIVLEDIRHIRRLYQKGNGQGNSRRYTMNSWSFHEIKRQIEYKAKWSGIPIIQLSVKDTRYTSTLCPQCGERLQEDRSKHRQLWCQKCAMWLDRDIVAAMNIAYKGWVRFAHSKGIAGEAMRGNVERDPLILRVDAMNMSHW